MEEVYRGLRLNIQRVGDSITCFIIVTRESDGVVIHRERVNIADYEEYDFMRTLRRMVNDGRFGKPS